MAVVVAVMMTMTTTMMIDDDECYINLPDSHLPLTINHLKHADCIGPSALKTKQSVMVISLPA
jgi:hypothetical protein